MKKQVAILGFFILLVLMSGCKSSTTGKVTTSVCDDACRQEKDAYMKSVNDLLAQAQMITSKISDWKTVTKKDLEDMTGLRDEVSALKFPQNFELVHDYYQRAFNHYVEAVNYVVTANEERSQASGSSDKQFRNAVLTKVVDNIQEARKIMVYADEEVKFATHIASYV